ncbi:MAG: YceI family protein [Caulobacteraceae bacterium]|nr:YceI family protein [Caulobacteraceae bacterium]
MKFVSKAEIRLRALACILGAAAVAGSAVAQSTEAPASPTPPTKVPASPALKAAPRLPPPGTYSVEPQHTEIMFGVKHLGFTWYYGFFSHASGSLVLDPSNLPETRLEVKVPVSSVLTTSPKLNEELQGTQWLNAASYPDMTFRSTKVTVTGADKAQVEGELTLHGVTRPVTLEAKFNQGGENPLDHHYTIGFQAHGVIKRSDFGVSAYVPMVGDEVRINISAAFERAPNTP